MVRPVRAFRSDLIHTITYRRLLTEIAMMGVGVKADVIRESVENVKEAIDKDGILRLQFDKPHNKRYSPENIQYPTPYTDVRLEADYKDKKRRYVIVWIRSERNALTGRTNAKQGAIYFPFIRTCILAVSSSHLERRFLFPAAPAAVFIHGEYLPCLFL